MDNSQLMIRLLHYDEVIDTNIRIRREREREGGGRGGGRKRERERKPNNDSESIIEINSVKTERTR